MARIGILMLDTRFPRCQGDAGAPESWPEPVNILRVRAATPDRVVLQNDPHLLAAFQAGARHLEAQGADIITTTCGFLVLHQAALQACVEVPVVTSSLLAFGEITQSLPSNRRCGILTIAAGSLGRAHLAAAAIPKDTPIGSTEDQPYFTKTILGNASDLDPARAKTDNVAAARALQDRNPNLGALLLECTNMPPYGPAISKATGLPTYGLVDLVMARLLGQRIRASGRP